MTQLAYASQLQIFRQLISDLQQSLSFSLFLPFFTHTRVKSMNPGAECQLPVDGDGLYARDLRTP
jgi:hypothetical protein